MTKKFLFFIILLVVMVGFSGCSQNPQNNQMISKERGGQEQNQEKQNQITEVLKNYNISTWKTYRNDEFGFEMRYPNEWEIFEDVWRKGSGHERLSRGGSDKEWLIAFNSGIIIDGEEWPIYLFVTNYTGGSLGKNGQFKNEFDNGSIVLLKEGNGHDSFLLGANILLHFSKLLEPGEGLGYTFKMDLETREDRWNKLDDIIKTIKFIE